jgi:regulator of ribonuclease activity A
MSIISTPDLCDEHGDKVRVIEGAFRHYGGSQNFSGQIATIKCFEDNSKVAERVKEAGNGRYWATILQKPPSTTAGLA